MPSGQTARAHHPYPIGADALTLRADLRALAESVDDYAPIASGILADRPASDSVIVDTLYFATNTGTLSRADGVGAGQAGWTDVSPKDAPAAVASLRTLGPGAQQAAPGNDPRLTNQRTPTDDSVTAAKVNAALKPSAGAAAGVEALRALGASGSTAAAGDDARLSDRRTPKTGSVTTAEAHVSIWPAGPHGGAAAPGDISLRSLGVRGDQAAAGNDARLSDQRAPTPASVDASKVAPSLKPSGTAGAGAEALRAIGPGAGQVVAGDDARLTDQRVPTDGSVDGTKVANSLKPSGGAGSGTEALRALGPAATQAAPGDHTHAGLAVLAAGVPSVRALGGAATQAAPGDHSHGGLFVQVPGTPSVRALGWGGNDAARGSETDFAFSAWRDAAARSGHMLGGATGLYALGYGEADKVGSDAASSERVFHFNPDDYDFGTAHSPKGRVRAFITTAGTNPSTDVRIGVYRVTGWSNPSGAGGGAPSAIVPAIDAATVLFSDIVSVGANARQVFLSGDFALGGATVGAYIIGVSLPGVVAGGAVIAVSARFQVHGT